MHPRMLEIFQGFAVAGGQLETGFKCWSVKQNLGDLATMLTKYFHCLPALASIALLFIHKCMMYLFHNKCNFLMQFFSICFTTYSV